MRKRFMIAKRIEEIANIIDLNNKGVFDIGSDHGYLLILLRNKNTSIKLKGVENKVGPFKHLKDNVSSLNIDVSLSDGIDDLNDEYSCIVLAGMGYKNIVEIISRHLDKLKYIDQIVIDSHTNIDLCREFFINLNFYIDDEIILKENGIYYEIISFKKGNKKYSEKEIHYGPILLKEKNIVFKEKYFERNKKIDEIMSKIGDKNSNKYISLIEEKRMNDEVIS